MSRQLTDIFTIIDAVGFIPVNPFRLVIIVLRDSFWFKLFIERRGDLGCVRGYPQFVEPHTISK